MYLVPCHCSQPGVVACSDTPLFSAAMFFRTCIGPAGLVFLPAACPSAQIYGKDPLKEPLLSAVSQMMPKSNIRYDISLYLNNFLFEPKYKILLFPHIKFHHFLFGSFCRPDKILLDSIT